MTVFGASHRLPITERLDFITCEYPSQIGGLADYTEQLAAACSKAGFQVEVWAPGKDVSQRYGPAFVVHRSFNKFRPGDLIRMDRLWSAAKVRRNIVLQWVPNGYGYDSLNVFFCIWIMLQALRGHSLRVMFHEFGYSFSEPKFHLKVAALIHRVMGALLLNCADSCFASCESVANHLKCFNFLFRKIEILPVPSNVPDCQNNELSKSIRSRFASAGEVLLGHFGLYSPKIEALLTPTLGITLAENAQVKVLFIGKGSNRYRSSIALKYPDLASRLFETGPSSPAQIAENIAACDFLFQPYQDGVSTKRGSAMAALANGKLLVCTESEETEEIWKGTPAVCTIQARQPDDMAKELAAVISSPARLAAGCETARAFYNTNFSIDRTVSALKA